MMSTFAVISDEIKDLVQDIIVKNSLKPTTKIKYAPGSEVGDGFCSRTIAVDAEDDENGKELHLFLKVAMGSVFDQNYRADKMFANEIYFYTHIYPAYRSLLEKLDSDDGFRQVPKCYGTRAVPGSEVVALENLKYRNYRQFRKLRVMDDKHILLTFKIFAKFHAVSYAFKDQQKDLYGTFAKNIRKSMVDLMLFSKFDKLLPINIEMVMDSLDPEEDKALLDKKDVILEKLLDIFLNVDDRPNEYSVLTQGDCWCNNMMYLYENEDEENPTDVILIDWQLMRHGSPAIDLGYFFYIVATDATIDNYETYLKAYHEELSKRLRKLGSNPDLLYPYAVLLDEWKIFGKYGFAMALLIMWGQMMDADEMPSVEQFPEFLDKLYNATEEERKSFPKIKNIDMYNHRMKAILKHLIEHDFL